jgi:hypothetical protein
MAIGSTVGLFLLGGAIGHVGPRLPTLFMTRAKGFNLRFPPHPEPVDLSPHLTQRVLHLRTFYWLSLVLAGVVLVFGAASLRWGSAPFGFGLWVASSWTVLVRLQNQLAGRPAPWSHSMAVELQRIMDLPRSHQACCPQPAPHWLPAGIRCASCGALLSRMARPDLGRPRSDGRLRGTVRLLITDGHPMAEPFPKQEEQQE